MKTDIQIAQENTMESIDRIARKAKIDPEYLEHYGKYKAKVNLKILENIQSNHNGKLILVTSINPTKAGEGKSTTTVGLVDGLARLNKMVIGALREPSLGPVFGVKGGATGGGYAQVVPMEDINLHFNGDMHAITTANNLISAAIDNHLHFGNSLNINPERIMWKRAMDMNDRSLRQVVVGIGDKNGVERKDGFNITVASEIMAILCLSKSLQDFQQRVEKAVVAYTMDDKPVFVKDLEVGGAVAMIMSEAIKPNLVQTLEKVPVLIHGGPFANIAHGCNSIIATQLGLKLADYVVTEAGFGVDLGAEKFMDIKCQVGNFTPNVVVVVATVRALKLHGGMQADQLKEENVDALSAGVENLAKHLDTIRKYRVPYVVAINRFSSDSQDELNWLMDWCENHGHTAVINESWGKGSAGAEDLAKEVIRACEKDSHFMPLVLKEQTIEEKVEKIVKEVYGGRSVVYSENALKQLEAIKENGWNHLNVCMAKNQYSLTDNPKLLGRPKDFDIHVSELRVSNGAGFVVVLTGAVMTMPGLPRRPAANNMGVDEKGNIFGLF